jgi:uncharacterized protein
VGPERWPLASREELLRTKSFADLSKEELVELAELMRRLQLNVLAAARVVANPRAAGIPTCAGRSGNPSAPGGEPVERAWRTRRRRKRRLVLLLDVSGSMAD